MINAKLKKNLKFAIRCIGIIVLIDKMLEYVELFCETPDNISGGLCIVVGYHYFHLFENASDVASKKVI